VVRVQVQSDANGRALADRKEKRKAKGKWQKANGRKLMADG